MGWLGGGAVDDRLVGPVPDCAEGLIGGGLTMGRGLRAVDQLALPQNGTGEGWLASSTPIDVGAANWGSSWLGEVALPISVVVTHWGWGQLGLGPQVVGQPAPPPIGVGGGDQEWGHPGGGAAEG
uniref:Uncharacterized protein n=1 Tax=Myotis myotis TaxID=51298 RepID=A0A7J7Z6C5_MYOMY|nr:hypothetical protein mMyoMyo1_010628 [Myotis myotis]